MLQNNSAQQARAQLSVHKPQAFASSRLTTRLLSQRRASTLRDALRQAQKRRTLSARAGLRPTVCVLDVTEDSWEKEVLKSDKPVLVDFWATWCGPCKLIAPLMDKIEQEFGDQLKVVKIEADPCPNLVEKYKVYGLPTIVLIKDGKPIKGSLKEGAIALPQLYKYLETHGFAKVAATK